MKKQLQSIKIGDIYASRTRKYSTIKAPAKDPVTRPPAVYGNISHEELMAKYEAMPEMSQIITTEDIKLVMTCRWAPEQYEAILGDELSGTLVGYLRLRNGEFTVEYPDVDGEEIFSAKPQGDGEFNDDEREHYLQKAKQAIVDRLNKEYGKPAGLEKEAEA